MELYGRFFRILRAVVRPFKRQGLVPDREALPETAVYICRHKNMQGPLDTMLWMEIPVRPWCFSVFCHRDTCYEHFYHYTMTVRFHWPKWIAHCLAWLASRVIPALIGSAGGIPVYRHSARVATTYRLTLGALARGESVILYPDVNYTDTSETVGELYEGYLLLHKLYLHATGKPLPFVPLYVDSATHGIVAGNPIYFGDDTDYNREKSRVGAEIALELERLSRKGGA